MLEDLDKSTSNNSSCSNSKKRRTMWPFRRVKMNKESWRWRWRFLGSAFKWKRLNLKLSFVDELVFKIMSVLEVIVLLVAVSFFFLCCGCHF